MKRLVTIIIIVVLIPVSVILFAEEKTGDKPMLSQKTVTPATDVHYTSKFCSECHEKQPQKGGNKFLKFGGDFNQLCRCHGYTSDTYIHPVDIIPSEEKKGRIPDTLPLTDGKLTCATCHNIYLQCQENKILKQLNKRFLRDAPFRKRTDICFQCHDEKKYKMLDPHNQLNAEGNIIVEKCLYCHIERPDVEHGFFKKPVGIHGVEVKLIGGLEVLCLRCHSEQNQRIHPANANHLQKPSAKTLGMMEEAEKEFGIILPLNYEEKITCATCHNPHERGIIPGEKAAAKGASEKSKLRLPVETGEICVACHKDKYKLLPPLPSIKQRG